MKNVVFAAAAIFFAFSTAIVHAENFEQEVVKISVGNYVDYEYAASSSGLLLDENGYLLTTANSVYDFDKEASFTNIKVCWQADAGDTYILTCDLDAKILSISNSLNLALLKIDNSSTVDFPKYSFSETEVAANDEISLKGFTYDAYPYTGLEYDFFGHLDQYIQPSRAQLSEESGSVSEVVSFNSNFEAYYFTNLEMNEGSAGAPVYNSDNELVGLAAGYANGTVSGLHMQPSLGKGFAYTISNDTISYFLLASAKTGYIPEETVKNILPKSSLQNLNVTASTFDDVQFFEEDFFNAISFLKDHNVIDGYPDGTFQAESKLNRAEFIKIVLEAKGISPSSSEYNSCFPDVKNQWFAPYVCYGQEQGWIDGYSDGTFKPDNNINRAEATKIMMSVFNLYSYRSQDQGFNGYPFGDVKIEQWFMQYVGQAKESGLLVNNNSSNFHPEKEITRGEMAEIVFRTMVTVTIINQ